MKLYTCLLSAFLMLFFCACGKEDDTVPETITFKLDEITIGDKINQDSYVDVNPDLSVTLRFSDQPDQASVKDNIRLKSNSAENITLTYHFEDDKIIRIRSTSPLNSYSKYELTIAANLQSTSGVKILTGKAYSIHTGIEMSDKFPRIPDEELLDLVQKQTFNYFWDFGHPVSGMARERTVSGDLVTTGGTGFGVMAMITAVERAFITRQQALERVQKIVTFLGNNTTRYHGAYAHWINGATGATQPFSIHDNGADIVETALLFQGLLAARAYFNANDAAESGLRDDITQLWEAIEWTWFNKDSGNTLYWHWSPDYAWQMNLPVNGWNESLIVYVLAAASPTYPINKTVYDNGWAKNGDMVTNRSYYGERLPLGPEYGGPLFLSQYSFLGINPKGLTDAYADYWVQNRTHSRINYTYCTENPKGYGGYSANCWGLTASDGNNGYSAHSPTNDRGVIAPTAALSSMPYTPEESMQALHFFYYKLGDKLWKEYGFVDAFNLSENWFDNQNIAIDQGPIVVMIENYRTGLLWSLFMSDPDIKAGMKKLGFQSPHL